MTPVTANPCASSTTPVERANDGHHPTDREPRPFRSPMRATAPLGSPCKCGEIHTECAAHNRAGRPCRRAHAPGLDVCRYHGAETPRAKNVTDRYLAQEQAVASLAHVQVVPIDDPLGELAEVAAEFRAMQKHMANEVAQLTSWTGPNHLGEEVFNVRVTMLRQLMADVSKLLTDWVRLGFDERMVALHERQAELVDRFVTAVLDDLDLDPAQLERAGEAKVRHLHVLTEADAA